MADKELEIGKVVAVDTAQVTIELSDQLKTMTKMTHESGIEVGKINSLLVIPVGSKKLVTTVTRVMIAEAAPEPGRLQTLNLTKGKRTLRATLIGTIDGGDFTQGISLFPSLDASVYVASRKDLDTIFGAQSRPDRFCIPIGRSVAFPDYQIKIDPDVFFGKHAAILGSTGSGKSCTIASLIQSVLEQSSVRRSRFIILDTNGEYRHAFQVPKEDSSEWQDANAKYKCLYIPTDPRDSAQQLMIPYWFMNADDHVRLFRAAPNVQQPVLLDALVMAKDSRSKERKTEILRKEVITEINRVLSLARGTTTGDARSIRNLCDQTLSVLANSGGLVKEMCNEHDGLTDAELRKAFETVRDVARKNIKDEGGKYEAYEIIGLEKRRDIDAALDGITTKLFQRRTATEKTEFSSVDSPRFYSKLEFANIFLDRAMSAHELSGGRVRDNCSTMLIRIARLLEDKRFEFLFGPVNQDWPNPHEPLAAFLRDILGAPAAAQAMEDTAAASAFPFYSRQTSKTSTDHNVVIVDLSLLSSDILENVTALLGRLILEFLQWLGDSEERGSFPVVLVLEEAHNYIKERRGREDDSISREVFERIAKEGRKYGLGLVLASQRPSELSSTALSQCNSFIVHRLQNPADLRYFREIVPGIYDELLDQLPSLAPQKALVLGESVKAPSLIEIRKAHPRPKSRNPGFMQHWTDEDSKYPDFENICKRWEGTAQEEQRSSADAGKVQADAKPATSTIDDLDSIFASEDEIPF
ncbi:DUF87 domain-containing protein [Candidatus Obscuribacterales bacterium]|nr:DUF87 domain-containing protein [Candidatus Obscuribacterales bacterium]